METNPEELNVIKGFNTYINIPYIPIYPKSLGLKCLVKYMVIKKPITAQTSEVRAYNENLFIN